MTYSKIIEAIKAEAEQSKTAFYNHIRRSTDNAKRESTDTRRKQYERGEITREQLEQYATDRTNRRIDRETAAAIARAEEISNAPEAEAITIETRWTSSAGGMNPHAEVKIYTDRGTYTASGSATGGNYDKESAATAEALNQIPAALKIIYDQRETGRSIYGTAQHQAAPKYEGGTGMAQIEKIFAAADIHLITHDSTPRTDHYYYERSASNDE